MCVCLLGQDSIFQVCCDPTSLGTIYAPSVVKRQAASP